MKCHALLDEDAKRYVARIVQGTNHMDQLLNDLLAYARLGGKNTTKFKPTDCNQVLNQALGNLEKELEESQAVINYNSLPKVIADRTQLVTLFQNLISNALKYRRDEQPQVNISVKQTATELLFEIHDNGIGIEPEYFAEIFEIFKRLHSSEDYPGSGIGLAICKKIIECHGGRIWLDSVPNVGTSFYFTLPFIESKF